MTVASAAEGTLLARLKADTRAQHEQAETTVDLLNPALTRAQYAAVLRHFRQRHAQLEPLLEATLHAALPGPTWTALDLPTRRKVPLLDHDLSRLECAPGPALPPPPWLSGEAHAWGAMYVLEGATLGGQVVSRHLTRQGLPDDCLHYHRSYGPDVGTRWRTFGRLLGERHAAATNPDAFAADALHAAQQTFDLFTFPTERA